MGQHGQLVELWRYPVKSLRGHQLDEATVRPWGIDGDRCYVLIRPDGQGLTARERPELLTLVPRLVEGGGLVVTAVTSGGRAELAVPGSTAPADVELRIHSSPTRGSRTTEAADSWFSEILGESVRLIEFTDPTVRPVSPSFSRPDDRVSFADGYPLLCTTVESLVALNELVATGKSPDSAPLSMTRFRPNLVIAGFPAWSEDGWRRIRIGDAIFRSPKGCARCIMTTYDPVTIAGGREPLASLVRHRRYDGQSWFGMNLIPDVPDVVLRPGDEVEILDAVDDPDGPPR